MNLSQNLGIGFPDLSSQSKTKKMAAPKAFVSAAHRHHYLEW